MKTEPRVAAEECARGKSSGCRQTLAISLRVCLGDHVAGRKTALNESALVDSESSLNSVAAESRLITTCCAGKR